MKPDLVSGNNMLFRNSHDVIISLLNKTIYSIQLNHALVPKGGTLCKNLVSSPVLQPALFGFLKYKKITDERYILTKFTW